MYFLAKIKIIIFTAVKYRSILHEHVILMYFPGPFVCPAYYYKCRNSFCIEDQYVCDGVAQCEHGEDEVGCGKMIR